MTRRPHDEILDGRANNPWREPEPKIAVALTVMHSARFDGNPAQAVS
jgi:hypothetical protein